LDKLNIPNISCKISAYCQVNSSEDPQKVERAISNVLSNMDIYIKDDSLKATSETLESLLYIHKTIHSHDTQKVYFLISLLLLVHGYLNTISSRYH